MIETTYQRIQTTEKTVNKLIIDPNLHYIQMIFNQHEGLPQHTTNADVYMSVITGSLSLTLENQPTTVYDAGMVIKIPKGVLMKAVNVHQERLELIVIKSFT